MTGALSASAPVVGPISLRRPEAEPIGSSAVTASAAPPAMRMLWQNTGSGDRSIWLMVGTSWDGSYAALPNVPVVWSIAGGGDFNGDGTADILWQNTNTGERSIWLMGGSNVLSYALLPQVPIAWSIAGVGDFNADGKPDIVWQNTNTGDRPIWLMNGSSASSYWLVRQLSSEQLEEHDAEAVDVPTSVDVC